MHCPNPFFATKPPANKGFTLVEIMIVVVIIGLLGALAIPAFQKVRAGSQDKAVLNNIRLLAAAADQYYMEKGTGTAPFSMLVGSQAYVKSFNQVANENYPNNYTAGQPIVVSGIAGVRTMTYIN
jgi:type IV pilus assembly protein PilA